MAKAEATKAPSTTVESLLMPGTPSSVRERYLSLEERALTTDFGPLEEDIVVIDTETTGLSFKNCDLIEIAAARLSGREVVDRFQTFVHPHGPIPKEITALTHISDVDVADAPSAEDAVRALSEFVAGSPVLAHNATFDRTFIEGVSGGRDVTGNWIDTLSLSRIALPRLRSHRLSDMAQAFGCDSVTHRAMADVDALCGMWRILLLGLSDLPVGMLALLAQMHEDVEWSFRPIVRHVMLQKDNVDAPFSLKELRHGLLAEDSVEPRGDAAEKSGHLRVMSQGEVRSAFGPDGVVPRLYEHYEPRPEQVEMALQVRDALASSTHRAIEAGTGVGKSMAYLLPEVDFARRNGVTVGVATKSNALTDQLVTHELPALSDVLGGVSFTSLKGYDHYPCLHRMDQAVQNALPEELLGQSGRSLTAVEEDVLTALAVTYAFSCQSPDGDLDALGIRWRYVPRPLLTTTPAECLRGKCPYFPNECLVHGARRRAASSDVVVTNHSLLLRDIDMDGKILPPVRNWVVDEAHGFEAEARRQWAVEVSGERARTGFELLGGSKTGAIHNVMTKATGLEGSTFLIRLLTKCAASSARAQVAMSDALVALHDLAKVAGPGSGYDSLTVWLDEEVRATPEWASLSEAGHAAADKLEEAEKDVRSAVEELGKVAPQLGADLNEAGRFLGDLKDGLRLIVEGTDETYVYSAQVARRKKDMSSEKLLAEKLDIGADLGERWLPEMQSVVFTSATIAVGKSFDHFDHAVGLDRLGKDMHKDVRLDSSFDYDSHMSVVVAKDMPQPNDPRYLDSLCDLLFDVHRSMEGSVLTLFTNRRDMELAYGALKPRLAGVGLEVLCQERGSSPRRLRESFLADKSRSLMALKSFWEGFDASGDTLRCVVIPKLPFASPRDPLVRERERREDRAWWKYSLPEAVIEVKQAAGRLIRSASDSGVLVLADSRLVTKRYGRQFLTSLPKTSGTMLECENVGRYIEMWRKSHE